MGEVEGVEEAELNGRAGMVARWLVEVLGVVRGLYGSSSLAAIPAWYDEFDFELSMIGTG